MSAFRTTAARWGESLAWAALAFGFYLLTGARELTWAHAGADGGDLIAAAWVGGVPHPSGYPLWTSLASLTLALPFGTPAWRAGLISALGGALAVGATVRMAQRFLPERDAPGWQRLVLGVTALALVCSPLLWGQSLIVEVYALQAGLIAVALDGLVAWSQRSEGESERHRGLFRAAFAWGLALANHLTALWLAPTFLWLLLPQRAAPTPDVQGTAGASAATEDGSHAPTRGILARAALLAAIGPLLYLTLPIRAVAIPPVNWGGADSLAGLRWLVSGEIYRHFLFALPVEALGERLIAWAGLLTQQFGPIGLIVALWGAFLIAQRAPRLVWALALFPLGLNLYAISYNTSDSFVYLIPNSLLLAPALAVGLGRLPQELGYPPTSPGRRLAATLLCAVAIPGLTLARFGGETVLWGPQAAATYVRESAAVLPPGALVFPEGDEHIFAHWYLAYVQAPERGLIVVVDGLLPYGWYRDALRTNHPTLRWPANPEDARAILDANRDHAPIFFTQPNDTTMGNLPHTPRGPLWQIEAR